MKKPLVAMTCLALTLITMPGGTAESEEPDGTDCGFQGPTVITAPKTCRFECDGGQDFSVYSNGAGVHAWARCGENTAYCSPTDGIPICERQARANYDDAEGVCTIQPLAGPGVVITVLCSA